MTPPWPVPHQASLDLEAGEPGQHAHALHCSGQCRASQKPRGAKEEKEKGGRGDKKKEKMQSYQEVEKWRVSVNN